VTILIVGESNPYGSDPQFALYHLPRNASGNRLREHLGLTDVEYSKLDKVNLCRRQWSLREARENAWRLIDSGRHDVLVLLGRKVRDAFGGPAPFEWGSARGVKLVGLPHPSGLNRVWREPDARSRAVEVLTIVAPDISWRVRPATTDGKDVYFTPEMG
jgi:uracil-DNA glycosylase